MSKHWKKSAVVLTVLAAAAACGNNDNNANGTPNSTTNGASNSSTNSMPNSMSNSSTNGMPNSTTNGAPNSTTNNTSGGGKIIVSSFQWVTIDIATGEATKFNDEAIVPKSGMGGWWDASSDGTKLAFAEESTGDISVVGSDFSAAREVLYTHDNRFVRAPHFSADSQTLYFIASNTVWSLDANGGTGQTPTEVVALTNQDEAGFELFPALWNPSGTHLLSEAFTCDSSGCFPTHMGVLDISTGATTQISGDSNGWTLAQDANMPMCNGTNCNVEAKNGGPKGSFLFGWASDNVGVYHSNRDRYNADVMMPMGAEALLAYDVSAPAAFADQPAYSDAPGLPVDASSDGQHIALFPASDNAGALFVNSQQLLIYDASGNEVADLSSNFDAANPVHAVRFLY